jgi:hypothetical protein
MLLVNSEVALPVAIITSTNFMLSSVPINQLPSSSELTAMIGKVIGLPKKVPSSAARMLPRIAQAKRPPAGSEAPERQEGDEGARGDADADPLRRVGQSRSRCRM